MKSSAIAHSNVALVKYWGRSLTIDKELNIPLNDNVSLTKDTLHEGIRLQTHTTIEFNENFEIDVAFLKNESGSLEPLVGRQLNRIQNVVNPLRNLKKIDYHFKMVSENDFPTQAGLASSASAFAALAIATADALNVELSKEKLSTYARIGSGSAARSIHGGFVYWHRGNSHESSFAEQICGPEEFELGGVIAIIDKERKDITSDVGHESASTSIFNDLRIDKSQEQASEIKRAILEDDFTSVGRIAEENCKYMHAVMMTSTPPLFYWKPNTLRVIKEVMRMRIREGIECYFTIDAGPNVHCLCRPEDRQEVQKLLEGIDGVNDTILIKPAEDSFTTTQNLF